MINPHYSVGLRQQGHHIPSSKLSLGFATERLQLTNQSNYSQIGIRSHVYEEDRSSPLAIALQDDKLVTASECGLVYLFRTDGLRIEGVWRAHQNAIFDIKWRPGHNNQLLTASGDQCLALWDLHNPPDDPSRSHEQYVDKIPKAHLSSVKTVSFMDTNVLVTGARDGVISIWDLRLSGFHRRVNSIIDGHFSNNTPQRPRRLPRNASPSVSRSSPSDSITAVLCHPGLPLVYSSSSSDNCIKLWDIRSLANHTSTKGSRSPRTIQSPASRKCLPYFKSDYSRGFSSLAFDSQFRLYASCVDHRVYCYEPSNAHVVATFEGHYVNNFTKIAVMKDQLVSGSTDGSAYIWPISFKNSKSNIIKPSYTLPHFEEVSAVAVDPIKYNIFTCSDNQQICKWMLNCDVNQARSPSGTAKAEKYLEKNAYKKEVLLPVITPVKKSPGATPLASLKNWLSKSNSAKRQLEPDDVPKAKTPEPMEQEAQEEVGGGDVMSSPVNAVKAKESITPSLKRIKTKENSSKKKTPSGIHGKNKKRLFEGSIQHRPIKDFFKP